LGIGAHQIDAQVAALRWQRVGPAVLLHNGEVTEWQRRRVCLINSGPHSVLTSFYGSRGVRAPRLATTRGPRSCPRRHSETTQGGTDVSWSRAAPHRRLVAR
jgi:hypothetical protein